MVIIHSAAGYGMGSLFPPINPVQLPDRSATHLHETKRRPAKLPIIPGAQLTLSRSKLGEMLYKPTSDFLLKDPVPNMKPEYNSLHDPHLRDYYHRRDLNDRLKKGNFITADNEVICSLKEYNTYEEYLERLKAVADKTYHDKQSDKMRKFIELQEKGLIPGKLTLAEMEAFLEKDSQTQPHRRAKLEDDCGQSKECLYRALDMERIKEEDHARLVMFENQYRHEYKREKYLKEVQEERDRKKQASMEKKCARQQKKIMVESVVELVVCPEDPRLGERLCLHPGRPCVRHVEHLEPCPEAASPPGHNASEADHNQVSMDKMCTRRQKVVVESEMVNEVQPKDAKQGEHPRLLPARPRMKHPDPYTETSGSHGHKAHKVDQKRASVLRESAIQKKKAQGKIMLPEESRRMHDACASDPEHPDEKFPEAPEQEHLHRSSLSDRPGTVLPALQSNLAKIYGHKGSKLDQKRAKKMKKRDVL